MGKFPMPAVCGGINFGDGWEAYLEPKVSNQFAAQVMGAKVAERAARPQVIQVPEPVEAPRKRWCRNQHENPVESNFCSKCGANLQEDVEDVEDVEDDEVEFIGISIGGTQAGREYRSSIA